MFTPDMQHPEASLCSVLQQAQLSGNAKMCNSTRKHRAWLPPGAGESQNSAQGDTNMLNLLVGITEPPAPTVPAATWLSCAP